MLDDTCYFIGFDSIEYAVYAIILLNSKIAEAFLKSITFSDAKRVFTKDLLMRLDLLNLAKVISRNEIEEQLKELFDNEFLLKEELDSINPSKILNFFKSNLGKKLLEVIHKS